jgi:hypothetical protein
MRNDIQQAPTQADTGERETMNDHSTLWGQAIQFWDVWGVRAMIVGAVFGFLALAATLFSSFVLYRVADKAQVELATKTQSLGVDVAAANEGAAKASAAAATANERAKELETNLVQARRELEKEKTARLVILRQIGPREMTNEQTEKFSRAVKGKVKEIWVFTLTDAESNLYAYSIMEALRRGGVVVHLMVPSLSEFKIEGISGLNLTIYDHGGGDGRKGPGRDLLTAFGDSGVAAGLVPGKAQLPNVDGLALFVGLKQPAFLQAPENIRGGARSAFKAVQEK